MTADAQPRVVPRAVEPQLMFTGDAAAALDLYAGVFGDTAVESQVNADDGTIAFASFRIGGARFRVIDSPPVHEFTFTPAISFAVDCSTAEDVDRVVEALSADGQVFMELGSYPFNDRYAWIADRFGVSWQVGVASGA